MATIEMWSIKCITLVAGWLLLSPICHLHQDYHNRILLGMRQRMRGSQLDGFLQAWTNFPPYSMIHIHINRGYMMAMLFYEVSLPGFQACSHQTVPPWNLRS